MAGRLEIGENESEGGEIHMLGLLLTLGAAVAASAHAAHIIEVEGEARKYWSQWRGPSGQGLVEGKSFPDTWSDTENVLWKVKVPGRGHSSPIVWRDRLFLTTAYDGARRVVLCFNRADGKLLWEAAAPEPESVERLLRSSQVSRHRL